MFIFKLWSCHLEPLSTYYNIIQWTASAFILHNIAKKYLIGCITFVASSLTISYAKNLSM